MTTGSESHISYLGRVAHPPSDPADRRQWLDGADALAFLASTVTGDVPIFVSTPSFILCSAFVPAGRFRGDYATKMLDWQFNAHNQWGWHY